MSECVYGICDGDGFVYDDLTNTASDCRCRAQIIARNRASGLSAVIPKLYQNLSFEREPIRSIDPVTTVRGTSRFIDRIEANLDAGSGLWFMGPVGTGKTALAMLVTESALKAGRSAARYTLPSLLSKIRNTFDGGSHSGLLEQLVAVDLLHIDDLGAEQTTPWVLEELYTIINARYEEQRSMVITTNLELSELSDQITERTVSRLTEMCEVLPVMGEDRRLELHPVR